MNQNLHAFILRLCLSLFVAALSVTATFAQLTPDAAGFVDVTTQGVVNNGTTDVTVALQNAIDYAIANGKGIYLPAGDYLISNTLIVADNNVTDPDDSKVAFVGDSRNPNQRARIILKANSAGFNDQTNPKIVVWMKEHPTNYNVTYNRYIASIDIVVQAGNNGAVGLRHQSAEGCGIFDVKVDMSQSGYVGVWGIPGSGGSTHKLTVIGGKIGLDLFSFPDRTATGAQPSPSILGATFINQSEVCIQTRSRGAFIITGCDFQLSAPIPVIKISDDWAGQPYNSSVAMIDSKIEYATYHADNDPIKMLNAGRSFTLTDVYVKNVDAVYSGDEGTVNGNGGNWKRFKELVVDRGLPTRTSGTTTYDMEDGIYLNGTLNGFNKITEIAVNEAPPSNLQSHHLWGTSFPAFNSPGAVNIMNYQSYKNGEDWAPAIQAAVNAAEIVFFPPGEYIIYNTVKLKPNSKLLGVSLKHSVIRGEDRATARFGGSTDAWKDARPMIETADDANAQTLLAYLHICPGIPYDAKQHYPEPVRHYALKWMAGRNSMIRMVYFSPKVIPGTYFRDTYVIDRNLTSTSWLTYQTMAAPYTASGYTFNSDCALKFVSRATIPARFAIETHNGNKRLVVRSMDPATDNKIPNLTITKGGSSFTATSIDICNAHWSPYAQNTVTIKGKKADGTYLTKSLNFATDGKDNPRTQLETVSLNWSGITELSVTSPVAFGFDNVVFSDVSFNFEGVTGSTPVSGTDWDSWMPIDGYRHMPMGIITHPTVLVTGHGGGKWYNWWQHGKYPYYPEVPFIKIQNNTEPLNIYHLHMQHCYNDRRLVMENANDVSIFSIKTEVPKSLVQCYNSDNIRIFGHGGMTNPVPGHNQYYFENCTNYEMACLAEEVKFGTSAIAGHADDPLTQINLVAYDALLEKSNGQTFAPDREHRPILWRRGTPYNALISNVTTYQLTTAVTGQGTVNPSSGTYDAGTTVTLTATPAAGYTFSGWSGDASGTTNPLPITMNSNKSITANFVTSQTYTLNITATNGSVIKSPDKASYNPGETVTLTATANSGYTFSNWSGDASGSTNPLIITINANKNITANFNLDPNGNAVTLTPAGDSYIDGSSTTVYGSSTSMKVRYHSDSQYRRESYLKFDLAPISGTVQTAKLRLYCYNADTETYPLNIALCNDDSWSETTLMRTNEPVNIGSTIASFNPVAGQYVEIDVTAAVQAQKAGDGIISFEINGTNAARWCYFYTKENSSNKPELVVTYETNYTLSVSATNGTVSKNPNQTLFAPGETVTLTATPNACYRFTGWSGDASGTTNPLTVTMNADKAITANFAPITYTLSVTATNGTVTLNPFKSVYNCGETVTLTATPNPGYEFTGWSGAVSGTANPITVVMDGNKSITANYALISQPDITLSPIHDSYIEGSSTTVYGSSTSMKVRYHSDPQWRRESYLKFDLGSAGTIGSAKLRLYCYNADTETDPLNIALCNDDSWSETTLMRTNEPVNIGSTIASFNPVAGQYVEIDVTAAVQAQKAGDGIISFEINGTNSARWCYFYTKENSSNKPELIISSTVKSDVASNSLASLSLQKKSSDSDGMPSLLLFPNPVSGHTFSLRLSGFAQQEVSIAISALSGQLLYADKRRIAEEEERIDMNMNGILSKGLYLLSVKSSEHLIVQRFVIE